MSRHAELADSFLAGCTILPLPLLWNFGPLAAVAVMVPLRLLGCYHGAIEQMEAGEGPASASAKPRVVRRASRDAGRSPARWRGFHRQADARERIVRSIAKETGMDRHARLADFFLAGCAILPLPLLLTFGPAVAFGTMFGLLVVGCYHGALEQAESGEGPLYGHGLDGNATPPDHAGRPRRPR